MTFQKEISSNLVNIRPCVNEVMGFISQNIPNINTYDHYDLKLVLNELLNNAVIHGNKENPNKKVVLTAAVNQENCITVSIQDEGEGFCYDKVLNLPLSIDILLKESGRGLSLCKTLMDDVMFNQKGNTVAFKKKVDITHG